ncbi:hypothetical protein SDC9_141136 [bioreactor metagenome]|uniref:DNA recombination protein RmuC n=1 Tax=bioreactor metagenome TaxID=1076179 RepID=A0A645DWT2_9ZZZZ
MDELNKMTAQNYEHRINLTETLSTSLNNIRNHNIEQNERQSKIIETAIANMQQSNEKKLDQMRETVDEKLTATLTTRLDSSFKTVSEQLEKLYSSLGEMKELSNGVTDNVSSLNRVLSNVKSRGTWAEVQLENILDETIPNMYEKNVATVKGSLERVEFAIKIPSSERKNDYIYLPVDSKFPIESYIRLSDAMDKADTVAIDAARKMLENDIRLQAKTITKYINVPNTTPFAIMFLATEGLYAEVISSKTGLAEKIQNQFNIMIAGPSTIIALLNSLSIGFKAVAINEKANEVRTLLAATKTQYDKFGVLLDKAKKKVDEAGNALGDAQNRSRIITKKLRNIDALDYNQSEIVLGLTEEAASDEIEGEN